MKGKRIKILHITPHLGGGVGKVILNYLENSKKNPEFIQRVVCLEYANDQAILVSKKVGFCLKDKMSANHRRILDEIASADIVLIHWWNHPLLYDFLVREQLPPSRIILWSHVSGFHSPYIFTEKILDYPDIFVFTTPISLETKEVKKLSARRRKSLRTVLTTGGVRGAASVRTRKHLNFNIGYIGTVGYHKMHPNFFDMCRKIKIPDVKFIVCGGPDEENMRNEAIKLGIGDKFQFLGRVNAASDYLPIFDIFGYPLAPWHYGTCDQSLQEAMAAGIVPVVLGNSMENYMVKNKITGIVARNMEEYIKAIEMLYKNKKLKESLSKNAKEYALENFSLDKLVSDWGNVFEEVLGMPKTPKSWNAPDCKFASAKDVFLESLGDYGKDFASYCSEKSEKERKQAVQKILKLNETYIWRANTQGTVHHYQSFFPKDRYLSAWSNLMRKAESYKNA